MSILDGYATEEERDYDDVIEAHKNGECVEDDCPVCIEEAYQRDMWKRLEDKRKAQEDAKNVMAKFDGLIELFKKGRQLSEPLPTTTDAPPDWDPRNPKKTF